MTTANIIMNLAVKYKDIYIKNGSEAFVEEYTKDYNSEKYSDDILVKAVKLTDAYLALTDGLSSRVETVNKQKEILKEQRRDAA